MKHALSTAVATALCLPNAHAAVDSASERAIDAVDNVAVDAASAPDHVVLRATDPARSRPGTGDRYDSEGGALFLLRDDANARPIGPSAWTLVPGQDAPPPRGAPQASPTEPWLRPLTSDAPVRRLRAARIDHPQRFVAGVDARFAIPRDAGGNVASEVVIEVLRDVSQLPAEPRARTALRVFADDQEIYAGLPELSQSVRRLARIDRTRGLFERVALVRIPVPAGHTALRMRGEPGAFVRVLAALPHTPAPALDASRVPMAPRDMTSPPNATFAQRLASLPAEEAPALLAHSGFFAPAPLSLDTGAATRTRSARLRIVGATGDAAYRVHNVATLDPPQPEAADLLYWLPPGGALTAAVDPSRDLSPDSSSDSSRDATHEPAVYRLRVVHREDDDMRGIDLDLIDTRGGHSAAVFEPGLGAHLSNRDTGNDGRLAHARAAEGALPVANASQLQLRWTDERGLQRIVNRDPRRGVWVSVERFRLAPPSVAGSVAAQDLDAIAQALHAHLRGAAENGWSDRDTEDTAALVLARRAALLEDPCIANGSANAPGAAHDAMALAKRAGADDPVLQRCAMLIATATDAPLSNADMETFATWTAQRQRPDLLTGLWSLRALRSDAADDWRRLSSALQAEGNGTAARWIERVAQQRETSTAQSAAQPQADPIRIVPDASAGGRGLSLDAYLRPQLQWAATAAHPLAWTLPDAGTFDLTLRAQRNNDTASDIAWVRLTAGKRTWLLAMPHSRPQTDSNDDVADDGLTDQAVRIALESAAAGGTLRIEPLDGEVVANLVARDAGKPLRLTAAVDPDAPVFSERTATLRTLRDGEAQQTHLRLPLQKLLPPADTNTRAATSVPVEVVPQPGAPLLMLAGDALPDTATYPEDPQRALIEALWLQRSNDAELAASATGWALQHSTPAALSPVLQQLRSRLRARYRWHRFDGIVSSEGHWLRNLADGQGRSPEFVARSALAGPLPEDAMLLSPGRQWRLDGLPPGRATTVRVRLHAALPTAWLHVEGSGRSFVLHAGESLPLSLQADRDGATTLTLGPSLPATWLRIDAPADSPLRTAHAEPYHITGPAAPLRIDSRHPQLLLLTEWDGRRFATRTQWVERGRTDLHAQRLRGAALRVDALELAPPTAPSTPATARPAPVAQVAAMETPAPERALTGTGRILAPALSWMPGAYAGIGRRRDPDDIDANTERFFETGARWRFRAFDAPWQGRFEAFERHHTTGIDVFGANATVAWSPAESPWRAEFSGQLLMQPRETIGGRRPASLHLRAEADYDMVYDDRWESTAKLAISTHASTVRRVSYENADRLDHQLQSRYRVDHPVQLSAGYRLRWRADWRNLLSLEARAASNPSFADPLDNIGVNAGWTRVGTRWTTHAGIDAQHGFADAHRRRGIDRLRIGGTASRYLLGPTHGWRLRLDGDYDLHARTPQFGVQLDWFRHDGQGLSALQDDEQPLRSVLETSMFPQQQRTDGP